MRNSYSLSVVFEWSVASKKRENDQKQKNVTLTNRERAVVFECSAIQGAYRRRILGTSGCRRTTTPALEQLL